MRRIDLSNKNHRFITAAMVCFSVAGLAVTGGYILQPSKAATYATAAEPDQALLSGSVARCSDANAANGQAARFGSGSCSPAIVASGQAVAWQDVAYGPGGAWHRLAELPDGSWLRVLTIFPSNGRSELQIWRSIDNARSWTLLSGVNAGQRLVDNGFLYVTSTGDVLLSARNNVINSSYRISQWRSTDNGASWTQEGDISQVSNTNKGLWEPFYHSAGSAIVATWADETISGYSQVIAHRVSRDNGKTWSEFGIDVTDGVNGRPGMPSVVRMANGRYMMAYEICGTRGCGVYQKTSNDGIVWPGGIGSSIPGQVCGPFITALSNGRIMSTACRTSDSNYDTPLAYSDDYGATWKANGLAFTDGGQFGNWPALYQITPDTMVAVSGDRVRFGTIGPR